MLIWGGSDVRATTRGDTLTHVAPPGSFDCIGDLIRQRMARNFAGSGEQASQAGLQFIQLKSTSVNGGMS